jgi:hypothetical protein
MEEQVRFLPNGQEVIIHKQIEGGYLVKRKFIGDEEDIYGEVEFAEKVFDSPPTEKFAEEIVVLNEQAEKLRGDIDGLKRIKNEETSTLSKIARIPNFQMVVDYLNGDFKYLLDCKYLKIKTIGNTYLNRNIGFEMVKGEIRLYTLDRDYFGSDKSDIAVFKTMEDAGAERKKRYMERLNTCMWDHSLKELLSNSDFSDLKQLDEIRLLGETKMQELQKKNKEQRIVDAKRRIDEAVKTLQSENEEYVVLVQPPVSDVK